MPRKLETELFFSEKKKKREKSRTKTNKILLKHLFVSLQFSYLWQVNCFLCFNQKLPISYHQVVRWNYFMRASKSCKTFFCQKSLTIHSIGLDGVHLTAGSMIHALGTGKRDVLGQQSRESISLPAFSASGRRISQSFLHSCFL